MEEENLQEEEETLLQLEDFLNIPDVEKQSSRNVLVHVRKETIVCILKERSSRPSVLSTSSIDFSDFREAMNRMKLLFMITIIFIIFVMIYNLVYVSADN